MQVKAYCENCEGGTKKIFINDDLIHFEDEEISCPKCNGKGYIEMVILE
jgi:hypothetical protein